MTRWRHGLFLAGLACIVLGAKCRLIANAGTSLPLWDEITAVGSGVLQPWYQGEFELAALFSPHNEHRVAFTRLVSLGLTVVNGQWDARLEQVFSAMLHAGLVVAIASLVRGWLPGIAGTVVSLLAAALAALPFTWENTLFGFQSQFFGFALFSLGQIHLTLSARRIDAGWILGHLCGAAALFTIAAGPIPSAAVFVVVAWRWMQRHTRDRLTLPNLAVSGAICVVAALLHQSSAAAVSQTPVSIIAAAKSVLLMSAWPSTAWMPFTLGMAGPLAWVAWRQLREPSPKPGHEVFLGLTIWWTGLIAAATLARGYEGTGGLASKYLDLLAVGVVLQAVAAAWLARERRIWAVIAGAWFLVTLAGMTHWSFYARDKYVVPFRDARETRESLVREFVATNDPSVLAGRTFDEIMFFDGEALAEQLAPIAELGLMPPALRRPVRLATAAPGGAPPTPRELPLLAKIDEAAGSPWQLRVEAKDSAQSHRFRFFGKGLGPAHGAAARFTDQTGEIPVSWGPPDNAGWRSMDVTVPDSSWRIEIDTESALLPIFLTEPVALGRLTRMFEGLLRWHGLFLIGGLALTIASLLPTGIRRFTR